MKTTAPLQQKAEKTATSSPEVKGVQNPLQPGSKEAPLQFKQNPLKPLPNKQNPLQLLRKRDAYPNNNNPLQLKENKTGLPDRLKAGVEALSGYSMDDVSVHYNSSKPAQLQALAYAQGTDIHIAPGQEKHLPHEAWHVVQQKQGRVQPTVQMKGSISLNDNITLEREADVMSNKLINSVPAPVLNTRLTSTKKFVIQRKITDEKDIQKINQYLIETKKLDPSSGDFIKILHYCIVNFWDFESAIDHINSILQTPHDTSKDEVKNLSSNKPSWNPFGSLSNNNSLKQEEGMVDGMPISEYLKALDKNASKSSKPLGGPAIIRSKDKTKPSGCVTSKTVSGHNNDCVLAAFRSAKQGVNDKHLIHEMTSTREGIAKVALTYGMSPIQPKDLPSKLSPTKRAFINAPAKDGGNYHAYTAFGVDVETGKIKAWDTDDNHADIKLIPIELIWLAYI